MTVRRRRIAGIMDYGVPTVRSGQYHAAYRDYDESESPSH